MQQPFGWEFIDRKDASSSATIEFVSVFASHVAHRILVYDLVPATDDTHVQIKLSNDAGSTWEGGTQYSYNSWSQQSGTYSNASDAGDAKFVPMSDAGTWGIDNTAAAGGYFGEWTFNEMNVAANPTTIYGYGGYCLAAGAAFGHWGIGGILETAETDDGIQILMSSGNIATGTFLLFGLTIPSA